MAIKASGETSFWWHVGHVCSSDSKRAVLIPMHTILNINESIVGTWCLRNEFFKTVYSFLFSYITAFQAHTLIISILTLRNLKVKYLAW